MLELGDRVVPADLAARLTMLLRRHRIPGAQVALYRGGHTQTLELGELSYRSGRPVDADTAFPVGSITKTFTATLAMMLVADGDLELDAPLADYLSELDEAGELTLRQVLSHTAGLAAGPDSDDIAGITPARYVREYVRGPNLVLPPGHGFSYSNMGYLIAGRLIEVSTGMSWSEAMSSMLLKPLGIVPAGRTVATGHSVNALARRIRPVRQSLADVEAPAGALAVSAADLVALGRLHVDGGVPALLPAPHAEQMRTPVPAADPFGLADGWGLGLAVFHATGGDWFGHDGNADGTACYLRVHPATGWAVALTSNASNGLALWRDLLLELAGAGIDVGTPRVWVADARPVPPPAGCAGTYANGGLQYAVLDRKDGLYLAVDDAAPTRLTFHDGLVFSVRDPGSGERMLGGRFLRATPSGRVDGLQIGGRLARRQMHVTHGRRELTA